MFKLLKLGVFFSVFILILAGCSKNQTEQSFGNQANFQKQEIVQEQSQKQNQSENNGQNKNSSTEQTELQKELKNKENTQMNKTDQGTKVLIKTNLGDIVVQLYEKSAPKTTENFLKLVKQRFYNGTRFHRVIKDFMIQGGDPLTKDISKKDLWGTGGPGYTFEDETNDYKLVRGSLAMANAGPNTNGSQFFIVVAKQTPWLDGRHTNFGKVVKGMDVVDKISLVETDERDRPKKDIIIQKMEIVK